MAERARQGKDKIYKDSIMSKKHSIFKNSNHNQNHTHNNNSTTNNNTPVHNEARSISTTPMKKRMSI